MRKNQVISSVVMVLVRALGAAGVSTATKRSVIRVDLKRLQPHNALR